MRSKFDVEVMNFERKRILDSFSILLPSVFEIMLEEYAQLKYPHSLRPEYLLTTPDLTVNLGFTILPNAQMKSIREVTEHIREILENTERAGAFRIGDATSLENAKGYWFDFRTSAEDVTIYNMHLIAIINGVVLQSSFNCLFEDFLDWKAIIIQMWESIKQD